mgnify:CR=1 FL=1
MVPWDPAIRQRAFGPGLAATGGRGIPPPGRGMTMIGAMGSRRRWQETQRLLLEDGVAPDKAARVISPIGLEINAESPNEIAVSIMAQIIMTQRGGDGLAMDDRRPTQGVNVRTQD